MTPETAWLLVDMLSPLVGGALIGLGLVIVLREVDDSR